MRLGKIQNIHFTGIGGIGMSGIAEVLMTLGYTVSGSDLQLSEITQKLEKLGASIFQGHREENIQNAEVLIYSSAVKPNNAEISEAHRRKIPVIKRAEMLGELMRVKYGIAIAGTHGKTTTTSLAGAVLTEAGLDPTLIIGGTVRSMDTNAKLGSGDIMVAEADEYDRSFLSMLPTIAVITNVEADHMDCYADLPDLQNAFIEFANKVPFYGKVIVCLDNSGVQEIYKAFKRSVITYGFNTQADIIGKNLRIKENSSEFDVFANSVFLGEIRLQMPGKHNAENALASIAIGLEFDLPFEAIQKALSQFSGISRRFEIKANVNGRMVIDDYAHHPTEILRTLQGVRKGWPDRRLIAIFQPHLYSRTRDFFKEFAQAFFDADILFITDIYPAREKAIEGISGRLIADAAAEMGHKNITYIKNKQEVASAVY